jgi:hypothetical protein
MKGNKMEYFYTVNFWIEADSIEEAEAIYESGDWSPDSHQVYFYNENGDEVEVELP